MTKLSKRVLFGEVAEFRNGLNFSKESRGSGCILIGIPEFKDRFTPDYASLPEINAIGIARPEDYVRKNDILFVRSNGNKELVGRSLFIDKDIQALFSGFCIRARIVSDETDPGFCAYFTRTSQFKSAISSHAGTNINNLNQGILGGVELPRFSLSSQQRVAAVLSALDAKIALNHRINSELEGMAKLLYDYWFVQYDFPLSAAQAAALGMPRLAGKPYRSSGGPMVYHEQLKREIPKGWVAKELSEIADIIMGQSPPGNTYNNDQNGVLFFQGSTDFGWRYPSPRQYTTAPTRIAKNGDILLSVRAPVGTLNLAPEECAIGRGLSALRSKSGSSSFLFQVLRNFEQVFARRNGDGTTFGSINRDDLRSLQLAYPSAEDLVGSFDRIVSETDALIFANHQQNQELTTLRDWLLPMLMNGQVTMR